MSEACCRSCLKLLVSVVSISVCGNGRLLVDRRRADGASICVGGGHGLFQTDSDLPCWIRVCGRMEVFEWLLDV